MSDSKKTERSPLYYKRSLSELVLAILFLPVLMLVVGFVSRGTGGAISSFFFVLAVEVLYFTPSIAGFYRQKKNANAILILNLFLGWTVLGWVVALIWAVMEDDTSRKQQEVFDNTTSRPKEATQAPKPLLTTKVDREWAREHPAAAVFLLAFVLVVIVLVAGVIRSIGPASEPYTENSPSQNAPLPVSATFARIQELYDNDAFRGKNITFSGTVVRVFRRADGNDLVGDSIRVQDGDYYALVETDAATVSALSSGDVVIIVGTLQNPRFGPNMVAFRAYSVKRIAQ